MQRSRSARSFSCEEPQYSSRLFFETLGTPLGGTLPLSARDYRKGKFDPYRIFTVRKHNAKAGFLTICVPSEPLMRLQRWLVDRVLNHGSPHTASMAFAPKSSILEAAEPHVKCRWLIKVDIRNFFESISEIAAYRVFHEHFGFQELVSFEMARLCTRVGHSSPFHSRLRWRSQRSRYLEILLSGMDNGTSLLKELRQVRCSQI